MNTYSTDTKFYDKFNKEIKEFPVLKLYHFTGARRKQHYMYKWVRRVNGHLVMQHLTNANPDNWVALRALADIDTRMVYNCEIVQQYE